MIRLLSHWCPESANSSWANSTFLNVVYTHNFPPWLVNFLPFWILAFLKVCFSCFPPFIVVKSPFSCGFYRRITMQNPPWAPWPLRPSPRFRFEDLSAQVLKWETARKWEEPLGRSGADWYHAWWLIPVSKWDITQVINGISRVNPLIIGVITHLLSGMNHQVGVVKT